MFRAVSLVILAAITCLALLTFPVAAQVSDTGFSVTNPKFADYYQHRGGARVLGLPVSREFDFLGSRVQFFQRAVLQVQPDGGVGLLNILDQGLLPYTRINNSTFPAPDQAIIQAAPSPSDPNYATMAVAFVQASAPDSWNGLPTNFFSTFINTVSLGEAFPGGNGNPSLLPLISLEIWGLPTSKPAYDPNNGNFVYLRFQRGIMHFDKTSGVTQGILIGDYLKSVITGQNLPPDLDQQAQGSKLYKQYTNGSVNGLARPADLPGTNMFAAFEKDNVVVPLPQPVAPPPAAVATTVPAAATQLPAAVPTPGSITLTGSDWFVQQTFSALDMLATETPGWYAMVRQNVFRITETMGAPYWDAPNRTLFVTEAAAFPPDWRSNPANQQEWYASLIVHHATHIEQALNGRASQGFDAEREARTRQLNVLETIETTCPGGQFADLIRDLLSGKEYTYGEWDPPRDPGKILPSGTTVPPCTPTPTG